MRRSQDCTNQSQQPFTRIGKITKKPYVFPACSFYGKTRPIYPKQN